MFREMRRKRQMLPQERVEDILRRGISGVLAWREKREDIEKLALKYARSAR